MKKFLLSLAVLAAGTGIGNAVTLSVADYTDVQGTHFDKELNEDGTTKTNERYQPLESFKLGGYTFSFSKTTGKTDPALYIAATVTARVYTGTTMTVTAPAGETMGHITLVCNYLKEDPKATASAGTVSYTGTDLVWNGEATSTVTFTFGGSVQIKGFEISSETGTTPVDPPVSDVTELQVADYQNVQGTHFDKELNEDGSTKTNERYQPLESFTIGDYKFSFAYTEGEKITAPALYLASKITARVYNGSTMTITAPAGMYMGQITVLCNSLKNDPNATSPEGKVAFSDGKLVWTGESANEVSISFGGTVQITGFQIAKEAGDTPENPVDPAIVYSGLASNAEGWTFDNITLPEGLSYIWQWNAKYTYLKGSAYYKQVYKAEAIAVSPVLDLTERKSATLDFETAFNMYKRGDDLIPVADLKNYAAVLVREEGATEWTDLDAIKIPEAFSWDFYANDPIDLTSYCGKKIQIGFKYTSSADVAGTWEVKNFVVKGESTAIDGVAIEEGAAAEYYDFNGRRVNADNLQKGMYIVRQGSKVSKVVIR